MGAFLQQTDYKRRMGSKRTAGGYTYFRRKSLLHPHTKRGRNSQSFYFFILFSKKVERGDEKTQEIERFSEDFKFRHKIWCRKGTLSKPPGRAACKIRICRRNGSEARRNTRCGAYPQAGNTGLLQKRVRRRIQTCEGARSGRSHSRSLPGYSPRFCRG